MYGAINVRAEQTTGMVVPTTRTALKFAGLERVLALWMICVGTEAPFAMIVVVIVVLPLWYLLDDFLVGKIKIEIWWGEVEVHVCKISGF